MPENYYQTLGVERSASADEIKKSYRKLARKYHPDVSKEADAEEKMQAINVAYDTLSNAEKKAEYDQMLDHPQGFSQGAGQGGFDRSQFYRQDFDGQQADFSGFEDLFGQFGAGFGGGHRSQGFSQRSRQQSYTGEDQHAKIEVDLSVAYQGATQQFTLQIPTYNAYGEAELQRKTLQVKIPKGMKEGQQIRLSGQGQAGVNGGASGDLYIEIHYVEDKRQYVEGADVYTTIDIAPWEAALGGAVEVDTPAGRLQVNIPANAKTGQQLRLKGKGIPNSKEAGHLYLILNVVLPVAQTDAEKQAYHDLAAAFSHFQPRSAQTGA